MKSLMLVVCVALTLGMGLSAREEAIHRVDVLQETIVAFCGPGPSCQPNTLDADLERDIVAGCIEVKGILTNRPKKWTETVKLSWRHLKPKFSTIVGRNHTVLDAYAKVDTAIEGF